MQVVTAWFEAETKLLQQFGMLLHLSRRGRAEPGR